MGGKQGEENGMFYVGVDLGKRRDHSAIAVVEKVLEYSPYASPTMSSMDVRLLERVPLGTPFPVVVNAVRELVRSDALRGRCAVAVDATGMGGPVVDMLKRAQLGCELTAVTITGGDRQTGGGSEYGIPKRDLIAGVQVLLELGQLRIARKLPNAGALMRELLDVRLTKRPSGRARIGADGCGEHDDLVIAVGLACWRGGRRENSFGTHRIV